jgi:hypothetical protein
MATSSDRQVRLSIEMLNALRKVLRNSPELKPYAEIIIDRADIRTKQEKISVAVNEVFRALPTSHNPRDLTSACIRRIERDLAKYGLEESPCDATVRQIVRKIIDESKSNFSKKILLHPSQQTYSDNQFSSTMHST